MTPIRPLRVALDEPDAQHSPSDPKPCRKCKMKDREIEDLREQVAKLLRAVQRESHHMESRRVHTDKR